MKDHKHMGVHEIAAALGVSRQRVHKIAETDPTFPAPTDDLKAGKVWHSEEVLPWIAKRKGAEP